jgi:SAM-dependent methyltransferase
VTDPEWTLDDVDTTRPSIARAYDYYLGGSHNFEIDRQMARDAMKFMPELPEIMRAQRAFLRRAVRFLSAQGIEQFLDIGSGIPTEGNVHEVAEAANPKSRVVYVDIDPVAVAHSREILVGNDRATALRGDMHEPAAIVAHPEVRRLIDFDQPVAVLIVGMIHFISDEAGPAGIIATYADAVAPGSYLVMTHATHDSQPEKTRAVEELYRQRDNPNWFRPRAAIAEMFRGLTPVEPGIVWYPQWRPDSPDDVDEHPERFSGYVGVFRRD